MAESDDDNNNVNDPGSCVRYGAEYVPSDWVRSNITALQREVEHAILNMEIIQWRLNNLKHEV